MQSIFWTAQSEVANAFLVRDLICCAMRFDCRQRVGNSLPASLIGLARGPAGGTRGFRLIRHATALRETS